MELEQIENIPSNYYDYRKEALLWAQKLSGKLWTDFNPHDPGVTVLEILSYVLTELDYKLGFTMEDILHSSVIRKEFQLEDNALFKAEDIFCTAPVTEKDFRVLLIDQIEGVTNAWLLSEDHIVGSFNLIVQLNSQADPDTIEREVNRLFNKYKVFGWSLNSVRIIKKKEAKLSGNFYFNSESSAESLLAKVLYEFNEKLVNVQPSSQTVDELLGSQKSLNEIFDGPKMENGIIVKEELKPFHTEIQLQVIKAALNEIEGVEMLSNVGISIGTETFIKSIPTQDYLPYINPKVKHDIQIFNDGKPAEINVEEVEYQYQKIDQAVRRSYLLSSEKTSSFSFSKDSRNRNIATFYRLLQEFPTLYRIESSKLREQQRLDNEQFKQMLLPFEQFLSNTMKQLAESSTFFAVENTTPDYNQQLIIDKDIVLKKELVKELDFLKKRNEVLNHLLSRFDSNINRNLPDLYYGDHPRSLTQRVKCKELLLKSLPQIGVNKGSLVTKHNSGISYLEYELMLKLWIDKPAEKPLSRVVKDWGITITKLDEDGKILVKDYLHELFDTNLTEKERKFYLHTDRPLENLLLAGTKKSNYSVNKIIEDKRYGLFLSLGDTQLKNLIHKSKSRKALLRSIDDWVQRFFDMNKKSEGFYVVDNSLLKKSALHAWHTVSFIFPAWSIRFQSRNFQQNVEELIIGCMPAHLRLNMIWLNFNEMLLFEDEYLDSDFKERPYEEGLFSEALETMLLNKISK